MKIMIYQKLRSKQHLYQNINNTVTIFNVLVMCE